MHGSHAGNQQRPGSPNMSHACCPCVHSAPSYQQACHVRAARACTAHAHTSSIYRRALCPCAHSHQPCLSAPASYPTLSCLDASQCCATCSAAHYSVDRSKKPKLGKHLLGAVSGDGHEALITSGWSARLCTLAHARIRNNWHQHGRQCLHSACSVDAQDRRAATTPTRPSPVSA